MRLAVLLAVVALTSACEEDMGQDDWLWIENTTSERVYVQESGTTGGAYVIGIEPGDLDLSSVERCDDTELVARSGSTTGPVVAIRSPDEGRDCTITWVIAPAE